MYVAHDYRTADSTLIHNLRDKYIMKKGIYWGGNCYAGKSYEVMISPFACKTYDGMTVTEDQIESFVILPPDDVWYYVGLFAKYLPYSSSKIELMFYPVNDYTLWDEKNYFIIFCKAKRSTNNLSIEIDNSSKETPDSEIILKRVANESELPTNENEDLIDGYVRWVESEKAIYRWDGQEWVQHNVSGMLTGSGHFSDLGTEINHNLGTSNYKVVITPVEYAEDDIGEWFVEKENNKFIVHRSGSATTEFNWMLSLT